MNIKEENILAAAQIGLSVLYTAGYFFVLCSFMYGWVKPPAEWKDTLQTLISLLTAGELMILQFWFSRSRGGTSPAPQPGEQ